MHTNCKKGNQFWPSLLTTWKTHMQGVQHTIYPWIFWREQLEQHRGSIRGEQNHALTDLLEYTCEYICKHSIEWGPQYVRVYTSNNGISLRKTLQGWNRTTHIDRILIHIWIPLKYCKRTYLYIEQYWNPTCKNLKVKSTITSKHSQQKHTHARSLSRNATPELINTNWQSI